ncbi:exported hypothetical protein [Syntrophobacter sp. SbD1]|nr:exported hypothetical protein [Syntrophobacter sp. SbD1]
MISAVLFFFGLTLAYTGFLVSGRDLTTGLVIACVGLIVIIKPALHAARYYRSHFGGVPKPHGRSTSQRIKTRKVHLKVVKSGDDKPTIH